MPVEEQETAEEKDAPKAVMTPRGCLHQFECIWVYDLWYDEEGTCKLCGSSFSIDVIKSMIANKQAIGVNHLYYQDNAVSSALSWLGGPYTYNSSTHTEHCMFCGATGNTEPHYFYYPLDCWYCHYKPTIVLALNDQNVTLKYKVDNRKLTFTSSNTSVVKVNASTGKLTPVKVGTAKITCVDEWDYEDSITVQVVKSVITLNRTSELTLVRGMTYQLAAKIVSSYTGSKKVTWSSSNTKVATVSSTGLVKARAKGYAYIYAKLAGGQYVKVKVNVVDPVPKLSWNGGTTLRKGKTMTLKLVLRPVGTTTRKWTSSNKAVASVSSSGVVKGLKAGYATISVTIASGRKVSVRIRVK